MSATIRVPWRNGFIEAANPDPIAATSYTFSERTIRRTEQAAAAVVLAGDRAHGALEVTARLLLRSEGLASSAIEGLRATPAEVAIAALERDAGHDADPVASWVADNLAVVNEALVARGELTESMLLRWHQRLMRSQTAIDVRHVGAYRDTLGWIGGTDRRTAVHVAAPAERIAALMADLFAFVARTDLDPVTQAAIAHAQFETIHPFADGNGRLGRVLIGWILTRRLNVTIPPPVSVQMARDLGGYQSGLTLFRQDLIEPWVTWFADAITAAATRTTEVLGSVAALQDDWRVRTADLRIDSGTRRLCDQLTGAPVLNSDIVATLLGITEQAARTALTQLADRKIITETTTARRTPGRPRRWFIAHELLALLVR